MPHKVKNKEESQKKENKKQQNNKSIQQDNQLLQKNDFLLENNPVLLQDNSTKMNKKEEAELKDSHKELMAALKMDTEKKEFSEKNKFGLTSDKGYGVVLSQVKKEKKLVDSMAKNLDKARREFSMPENGGTEYEALRQALSDLNWAEHKEDMNYAYLDNEKEIEACYIAVEKAALTYVETHNRHHATLQGSRRLKYAKILAENIRNHEYLKERQISLKEEVSFAKEDAKKKYVKDDKITKVSPKSSSLNGDDQKAIGYYATQKQVITMLDYERGVHLGPYQVYLNYQFINGIRRGIIKKEEAEKLQEDSQNIEGIVLLPYLLKEALKYNEQLDHVFEHNQGLGSTSIVYRGIGTDQMKAMLNLPLDADLSDTDTIAEKLESMVGKVVYDDGFVSTSREKKIGEKFALDTESPIGMMMEIVARKGSPMIDISQTSQFDEKEQLVKNGSKMLIRGFSIQHIKAKDGKVKPVIVLKAEMRK